MFKPPDDEQGFIQDFWLGGGNLLVLGLSLICFFFYRLCFLEMLNFLPIMLKIMPNYASKFCKSVYKTILIEQEMTILSFIRNKK